MEDPNLTFSVGAPATFRIIHHLTTSPPRGRADGCALGICQSMALFVVFVGAFMAEFAGRKPWVILCRVARGRRAVE